MRRLEDAADKALQEARRLGATAAEAATHMSTGLALTVRHNAVETIQRHVQRRLALRVFLGKRTVSVSTTDCSAQGVALLVAQAMTMVRLVEIDPWSGLPPAARLARSFPDLDLYHPWTLTMDQAIACAKTAEAVALACDSRLSPSAGAVLSSTASADVLANSLGFVGRRLATQHGLLVQVMAAADAQLVRDSAWASARRAEALESPEDLGRQAAQRTLERLGARRIASQKVPVIYPAELARGLVGHLLGALGGGALYRKASYLCERLGTTVAAPLVTITEDPHLPGALGSTVFDAEGVATMPRTLVAAGTLQGYLLDSYAARRLGLATTGNAGGAHNATLQPGTHSLASLCRIIHRGVLLRELLGQGVHLVTGDYSRGFAGFWIENGAIAHPIHECTVAGNLDGMWRQVQAVGDTLDTRGTIRSPAVVLDDMTIAGR